MGLKRLEMLGFKSFADKTTLNFDPGITVIVGPNGCGKSNISDAFRWVLGEQSAKSMRGSKMPDIIFAGATQRKPHNFAEVTITLTDIQGKLPIEYHEVAVTRRLHRSGESEYLINKHPVRLKDVQTLFLDSGIAYSIFEQGKIDQVINFSPLERRYIFEEAAGILRFLQRKKEAFRKLEQADLNVSRVKDIHKEVEKQIIVLEEQSEKARQFKENKNTLDKLEKCLLISKWEALQAKLQDFKLKISHQEAQILASNAQVEILQGQLLEAKDALAEAEKGLKIKVEAVFSIRSTRELQSKEKQTTELRLKDLIVKEKSWQTELEMMVKRRCDREGENKSLLSSQKDTDSRFKEFDERVKVKRENVRALEEELMKEREKQQLKQKELFKLMQTESRCESELRQANVRLENTQERQTRLYDRKERLSQVLVDVSKQSEEKRQQLQEAVELTERQKDVFLSMEDRLQEIAFEMSHMQGEMDRINLEFFDLKARQKALQRLRDDMEGFSAGGKKLLKASSDPNSPFFSKIRGLYEYLIPEKGKEATLATVMKPYAETLIVQSETDFCLVVDYIKEYHIKDVSLVCLDLIATLAPRKEFFDLGSLSPLSLAVIESQLSQHFLQGVYVEKKSLSTIEAVKTHQGLEVCLSDGVYIDRRCVVFYASQGENNVFLREAELKALDRKLDEIEQEKKKFENIWSALQQKRDQIQNERSELDKAVRRAEMKVVELNFSVQKTSIDLEKMETEDKALTADWLDVEKSLESLSLVLKELSEHHKRAKEISAEAQKQTEELTIKLAKLGEVVKEQVADLRANEASLQMIVDEQRKHSHALHVLEVKDLESIKQEKRLAEEIEIGRTLQAEIALKGVETNAFLQQAEIALDHAVAACKEAEQQVAVRKSALGQFENKINDRQRALRKDEGDRNQSQIQATQLESQANSLENDLAERHKITVEAARKLNVSVQLSIEEVEKQILPLRQLVENAGDINMTSIEECEKHKTRYQFLNQQIDDLVLSKEDLMAIIANLDSESRKIFEDTFQKIRANFRKNFEILFSGGEADLQFTESADILEAGIEIIAKPPGKQMRSINLLSGGEKCLTAMALLFAIFEVKPAPFCILDEIDAPLDDANVERFVNIVKQFVENCQFIIITHNKRTMAIADIICGVSMEERGVSKLLSIDFSKNALPAMASVEDGGIA